MKRLALILAALLGAVPAFAAQENLDSTYALQTSDRTELTELEVTATVTSSADSARFVLFNVRAQNTTTQPVTLTLEVTRDDVTIDSEPIQVEASSTATIQLPFRDTGLSVGAHTWEAFVTSTTNGQVNLTTATYLLVEGFEVVAGVGADNFTELDDTPSAYTGEAGQFANVNAGETAVEFDALVAGDIPNLAASKITSGQLAVAQGGTGADMSATGGANQFVRQSSSGGAFTVSAIADADVPDTITIDLAATATALAANGANCSAGSAPLGTDASGAVESCTDFEEDLSNSAGLLAALSDETGTGVAVFGTSPTIATPNLTGAIDWNDVAVDDDDCTGQQGEGWYDSTDSQFEFCNANSGTPVALPSGTPLTGSLTSGRIPVASGASTLADTANFTFDTSNFRLRGQNLTTADDNATNMVQFSGTLPATPSADTIGAEFNITGAGSASFSPSAMRVLLGAGYTGSNFTRGLNLANTSAGTGTTLNLGSLTNPAGNAGAFMQTVSSTTGVNYGAVVKAIDSTTQNISLYATAPDNVAGSNISVLGAAANSTEATDLKNVGGYFTLDDTLITGTNVSVALIAQGDGTDDIFRGYDDTTLMFRMEDTGEFTSAGTASLGWSVQSGANTACTTTCTAAAVFGFDNDTTAIVGPADASADACVCGGAS